MNQVSEESKSRWMKTLAVLGFILVLIFAVWLAVQIVRVAPTAFSSLASLAESIQLGRLSQNEIVVETNNDSYKSKESFTISWSDLGRKGVYTISYDCDTDVVMDIRVDGEIIPLECEEPFVLPKDTFSVEALVISEQARFANVKYTIAFVKDGEAEPSFTTSQIVTAINASFEAPVATNDDENEVVDTPSETDNNNDDTDSEVTTPAPNPTPKPTTPTYTYVKTYTKPVSNPNGYTDLAVTYLGVGVIKNDQLIKQNELEADDEGAFQFSVKNTGTKDSGDWHFVVKLPSGGTFTSKTQAPLKVNEQAILTIAFDNTGRDGVREFGVTVVGGSDTNSANNSFSSTVRVND